MLTVRGLCKSFGRPAVDHLDLSIAAGEIYALLGPNGAGKTTTLRMVCGLLAPDAGSIEIAGTDALAEPARAKQVTAWLPDEPLLYDRLTPLEYLEFVAGLWQVPAALARARAESLLTELGLWPHRGEACEGFSRGMRQKTALAGALLHDPALLIMDEPLSGSSMMSNRGSCSSAPASAVFCRMPRENPSQNSPACGHRPSSVSRSFARVRASSVGTRHKPATNSRYSSGVSRS